MPTGTRRWSGTKGGDHLKKPKHVHCGCGTVCRTFGEQGAADRHRALHYSAERLKDAEVQKVAGKAPNPHPYPSVTDTCPAVIAQVPASAAS